MTRDDDELGPVRECATCREEWPWDDDFWDEPEDVECRACKREARATEMRRYRARRRAARLAIA